MEERMSRNEALNKPEDVFGPYWSVSLAAPWGGGGEMQCTEVEIAEYRADPDAFAAKHFGLSKEDYREWCAVDGRPLCGARTKSGAPCRNGITSRVGHTFNVRKWLALHRSDYCGCHQ